MADGKAKGLKFFEKYLTIWVALGIVAGVIIGQNFPGVPRFLDRLTYAQVSIPVAVLIWFMIYPMMVQIDFSSIVQAGRKPKGLALTLAVNWLIKPFTMLFFAWLFLQNILSAWIDPELARQYVAGAILLGAAPCTAMVFVWSYLSDGDPAYTLVQVAVNDLVLLFAFVPIVMFELGIAKFTVPYDTIILSVVLYVVIPLVAGYITRTYLIKRRGIDWFEKEFLPRLRPFTVIGLLLTLVILFTYEGKYIVENPIHIALIAIPLLIQTYFIFAVAYLAARAMKLEREVAAPAAMIGASNFFELAVAVAISLFGLNSGAALATVVGVLVEVPVMLSLVAIANRTKHWFPEASAAKS